MNFFPQPCLAHPESPKLKAKQGHAKSATFANNFSDLKNNPFRLYPVSVGAWRPLRESPAFSLTEVVIAMGVAAVAFTSIIALFPLGLNMSKESYEATQAALIAQTILADVTDQQTGNTNRRTIDVFNSRQIQITNNSDPSGTPANYILVPINNPAQIQTVYIAYKPFTGTSDTDTNNPSIMRPVRGQLNGAIPVWYTNGSNGCFALVKATFSPTLRYNQPNSFTGVRLDISIETPGSANISNRTCFLYTTAFRP
jgi:uncharacterized protein (TIGR02598 family)